MNQPTGLTRLGLKNLESLSVPFLQRVLPLFYQVIFSPRYNKTADHIGIIAGGVLGYEGKLNANENLEQLFMDVVKSNHREG